MSKKQSKIIDLLMQYSSKWGHVHDSLFGSRRSLPPIMTGTGLRQTLREELLGAAKTWGAHPKVGLAAGAS